MSAYYNEFDPHAAAWLRELIARGLVAPGDVDERSITEVTPDDVRRYTQCHFFAGIGVWSYALRRAGWADDAPVWTGSCPCQPFSASGKRRGTDDERHLWPAWFRLLRECRPDVVFGEQVASKAGLGWLDLVSADLEGAGYAVGACDFPAAGVGAPHIRQRLYCVGERIERTLAESSGTRARGYARGFHGSAREVGRAGRADGPDIERLSEHGSATGIVGDTEHARRQGDGLQSLRPDREESGATRGATGPSPAGEPGIVADAGGHGVGEHVGAVPSDEGEHEVRTQNGDHAPVASGPTVANAAGVADTDTRGLRGHGRAEDLGRPDGRVAHAQQCGEVGRLADDDRGGCDRERAARLHERRSGSSSGAADPGHADGSRRDDADRRGEAVSAGQLGDAELAGLEGHDGHGNNGHEPGRERALATRPIAATGGTFWSDAQWIPCRDGKARPVEPGTQPLAYGAPARVVRLRGYGNALCAPQAQAFIEAYLDLRGDQ